MLKKIFAVNAQATNVDLALLLIRLVMGTAFLIHGWGKIQTPMSWMPPGAPVPGVFQLLAAISEFGGGLALLLGLLTRLGALGLTFTMAVAASTHFFMLHDPFVNTTGQGTSAEPAMVYLVLALFFLMNGPGKFSLDRLIFGQR